MQAAGAWIRDGLAQETKQRRLFLWLAVAFGLCILVCLSATADRPNAPASLAAAERAASALPVVRARPVGLALAAVAALLGFAAAAFRVTSAAGPVLTHTLVAPLSVLVESLDEREGGARLIVRVTRLGTLDDAARPLRVSVSYSALQPLRPGDTIARTERLLPPPEAGRPGGYDFSRDAYFRGIGAVGSH